MAKSEKISLKLLVDEKKNKVVLAEAGQDFVDVLFGLLTFPMGTIARLLEKHQKLPQILGCYKNLSRSVSDMAVDDFKTEACKRQKVVTLNPIDPKTSKSCTSVVADSGFVKRNTKFIVSDDLIITPMNKFSTIGLLKKMQINMNDFEAQSICIYKAELVNILRASLTSSSALTNVLSNLLAKEPKKES
ncbi:unnamed protein product [Arabidopsis thaliana]|uniref:(thale cress) hypothetical protein n=1 Tax=Arabidopsis thaliana TaxID=3702 RepID=A0A7G2ENF1_ARATH|nr:unnamed protein product [Arabidopsis thaliana]